MDNQSGICYHDQMRDSDVQLQGFGRSFQLKERRRSSRIFRISPSDAYVITLSAHYWKTFDQMKQHIGSTDVQMLLDAHDYAEWSSRTYGKSYVEGLHESLILSLQFYRNAMHQVDYGIVPANADQNHNLLDADEINDLRN